jgi:hypothetical protein
MGERGWRDGLRWALGLLLILYLAAGFTDKAEAPPTTDDGIAQHDPDPGDQILIARARPSEIAPGGTLVLELTEELTDVTATLNGRSLDLVVSRKREWVFQVPDDIAEGDHRVLLQSGARTSEARLGRRVQVRR